MALVAMSFIKPSFSLAQTESPPKAFSSKIKTPDTSAEFNSKEENKVSSQENLEPKEAKPIPVNSGSPRKLQQHGLGIGLGETFLLGKYSSYGKDKITADILYSYAASYSFDLLVNAHMSEHKDANETMKLTSITSSIKGRVVEYDNFSPYLLGGLGFYAPKAKRNLSGVNKWSQQKVTFGLNFGGGVDLRLNDHYVVGILAQMHWPFKVQQESQPDLKGYYMKLLITGMYLF